MRREIGPADERVPRHLVAASVLFGLFTAAEVLLRALGVTGPPSDGPFLVSGGFFIGVLTAAPFVVAIGYAGVRLGRSDLPADRYRRVATWCLAGAAAFLAINLAVMAVMPTGTVGNTVAWLRWAVAMGGGTGVFVGLTEARAIQSALVAERRELEAEHLKAQRDLLDYLNSLLRHEVLNAVNVIGGYASLLKEERDPDDRAHEFSEIIRRQSEDMTRVIQDVRVLLSATGGGTDFEPVDLTATLRDEIRKLTDAHEEAAVEADLPDGVRVDADVLLARVFGNLLANAVEHHDGDEPRVSVSVEVDQETVRVAVADDGPGVPDEVRETLFERPTQGRADHGLGLYLVGQLVDHYGGSIELAETGPDGSVFVVALPRTDGEPEADGAAVDRSDATAFVGGYPSHSANEP